MVMESLVDVTALREAQDALADLDRTWRQRVQDEVAAREEAQRRAAHADRIQALGQLAGGIAHDFNNVLQAVAGGAALIARRPDDAEGVIAPGPDHRRRGRARGFDHPADAGAGAPRRPAGRTGCDAAAAGWHARGICPHARGRRSSVQVEVAPRPAAVAGGQAQLETALVNLADQRARCDAGRRNLAADGDLSSIGRRGRAPKPIPRGCRPASMCGYRSPTTAPA